MGVVSLVFVVPFWRRLPKLYQSTPVLFDNETDAEVGLDCDLQQFRRAQPREFPDKSFYLDSFALQKHYTQTTNVPR